MSASDPGSARLLRVAIVGVGDELLAGELVDTNSAWLARLVRGRGHVVAGVEIAGDDVGSVAGAVGRAAAAADVVLVTGGLGPTADDLTRDGVAKAFGLPLEERAELIAELEAHAARAAAAGRASSVLSAGSRRQAEVPRGAEVLANQFGTAPGFVVRVSAAAGSPGSAGAAGAGGAGVVLVACMPGVPSEMRGMAQAFVERHVPRGPAHVTRRLLACGPTEAAVGEQLVDLMHHAGPWRGDARLGITVTLGVLSITIRGNDAAAIAAMEAAVRERLGAAIFGEGDATLAGAVVALLAERGLSVSTAESCTGGLLAGAITSVPGSSAVFREGLVAYSYEAKQARLGVPEELIAEHGAVSEVVALAMARGQRERAKADVAVAISGIAGPGGGTASKPVGTVVFALAHAGGEVARTRHWKGAREEIRGRSVTAALEMLRRWIVGGA